jgi:hypothetical protein
MYLYEFSPMVDGRPHYDEEKANALRRLYQRTKNNEEMRESRKNKY